jgi:hypothetical protein
VRNYDREKRWKILYSPVLLEKTCVKATFLTDQTQYLQKESMLYPKALKSFKCSVSFFSEKIKKYNRIITIESSYLTYRPINAILIPSYPRVLYNVSLIT